MIKIIIEDSNGEKLVEREISKEDAALAYFLAEGSLEVERQEESRMHIGAYH